MFSRFAKSTFMLALLFTLNSAGVSRAAEGLRYRWKPNQKIGYLVTVTADLAGQVETYQGHVLYSVKSIDGDSILLLYEGGLDSSIKKKGDGNGSKSTTYSANTFQGLALTNTELIVSPRGQVVSLKKESQLPYMLGNLSLLVFESVPEGDPSNWTVQGGVGITEKKSSSNRFGPPFGPGFGPRGFMGRSDSEDGKTSAATTTEIFKLQNEKVGKAVYNKEFTLKSPGEESINIQGNGTWTFDRNTGLSDSLDYSQKITVTRGNTTTTIPVTITYRLLTSQEREKVESERAEAARLRKEAHEKFWADKKQKEDDARKLAETPLTAQEKSEVLTALAPKAAPEALQGALEKLSKKALVSPDPAIADAIRPHLHHADLKTRRLAEDALASWNADYKKRYDIFVKYRKRHSTWEGSGRKIDANTPLVVGQLVLAKWQLMWETALITELKPDGQVAIQVLDAPFKATLARDRIQLPHSEYQYPEEIQRKLDLASGGPAAPTVRTWTDVTGQFRIEATLLSINGESVKLKRADGREIELPLAKLSAEDQAYVRKPAKSANPFE